jgi:hypothetical protein
MVSHLCSWWFVSLPRHYFRPLGKTFARGWDKKAKLQRCQLVQPKAANIAVPRVFSTEL